MGAPAQHLIDAGAEYALISDAEPGASVLVNLLFDETGVVRRDAVPRIASPAGGRFRGAGDTLSAGLAGWRAPQAWLDRAAREYAAWNQTVDQHAGPTNVPLPSYAHVVGAINRACDPTDLALTAAGGLPPGGLPPGGLPVPPDLGSTVITTVPELGLVVASPA